MNIKNLVENGNAVLLVTAADLAEFAQAIYEANKQEVKETEKEYTPSEFAEKNRVSKATLWRWVKAGTLKQTRRGGKVFYKQSDLKEG